MSAANALGIAQQPSVSFQLGGTQGYATYLPYSTAQGGIGVPDAFCGAASDVAFAKDVTVGGTLYTAGPFAPAVIGGNGGPTMKVVGGTASVDAFQVLANLADANPMFAVNNDGSRAGTGAKVQLSLQTGQADITGQAGTVALPTACRLCLSGGPGATNASGVFLNPFSSQNTAPVYVGSQLIGGTILAGALSTTVLGVGEAAPQIFACDTSGRASPVATAMNYKITLTPVGGGAFGNTTSVTITGIPTLTAATGACIVTYTGGATANVVLMQGAVNNGTFTVSAAGFLANGTAASIGTTITFNVKLIN